jgi:hypothetical protein
MMPVARRRGDSKFVHEARQGFRVEIDWLA